MNWIGIWRKRSWPIWRHYSNARFDEVRKTKKGLAEVSWPRFEPGTCGVQVRKLPLKPTCLIRTNKGSRGSSNTEIVRFKGPSTLLVLARRVLVGRLVWLLLVLVNLRPHYFSCSPGFDAWGCVYLLVVCIGCSTSTSNVDGPLERKTLRITLLFSCVWFPNLSSYQKNTAVVMMNRHVFPE
jgi:hypothetical protein